MLKRIGYWLLLIVLSYALAAGGLGVQGRNFLYLYIGISIFLAFCSILFIQNFDHPIAIILIMALVYGFVAIVSWILSKILNIDFYIAFEILTLILSILGVNINVKLY